MKFVALLLGFLLILWLGYQWDTSKQYAQYEQALAKERSLKQEFTKKAPLAQQLPFYQDQVKILKLHIKNTLKKLPYKTQLSVLLQEISKQAQMQSLQLELITPLPLEPHALYAVLPIRIQARGSYSACAIFMSQLAALPEALSFSDFSMTAVKSQDNTLNFQLLLLSYWAPQVELKS